MEATTIRRHRKETKPEAAAEEKKESEPAPSQGFLSNLERVEIVAQTPPNAQTVQMAQARADLHPAMPPTAARKHTKVVQSDPSAFSDLFVNNKKDSTPVLGADRRSLLTRINQYKLCFEECSKIKVPANASDEDLAAILEEAGVCVSLSVAEKMLGEALLGVVEVGEVISAPIFDVRGTAAKLRLNTNWNRLCTQLWIKHNCFTNLPPEYQLIVILISTAVAQYKDNRQARSARIDSYAS